MKVLVCGGRDYTDSEKVYMILANIHANGPITRIIQGGAAGVDLLACEWAEGEPDVTLHTYMADWQQFGVAAGPIRNAQMLNEGKPDFVLAFPGGRGTADMVAKAMAAGVEVREVEEGPI